MNMRGYKKTAFIEFCNKQMINAQVQQGLTWIAQILQLLHLVKQNRINLNKHELFENDAG